MMLAILSDLHLMEKSTKNRTDDLNEIGLKKFKWCLFKAQELKVKALLVSGDFFDKAATSYEYTGRVLKLLKRFGVRVITVAGQHDMRYHTRGIENTPLGILKAAGVIEIPTIETPITIARQGYDALSEIKIFGCSWGDEHKLKEYKGPGLNGDYLLIHKMIVKDKPLFPGQTDYISAKNILKKYKFKAIFSGDNHEQFTKIENGRALINSGSLMRTTKAQLSHTPALFLYEEDSERNITISRYKIPIENSIKVFDFKNIKREEEKDKRKEVINEFITTINSKQEKINFLNKLNDITSKNEISQTTRTIIDEVVEEANGNA